jgi:membrane peptidoglycan carboxypeptidase
MHLTPHLRPIQAVWVGETFRSSQHGSGAGRYDPISTVPRWRPRSEGHEQESRIGGRQEIQGKSATGKSGSRKHQRKKPSLIRRALRYVFGGILRIFWAFFWRVGLALGLILAAVTGFYYTQLPAHENLFDGRGTGSVTMLDRDGNIFAWRGEQYGGELAMTEVSPHLVHAVIAAEDKRYYSHPGIDPIGITRAMVTNLRAGRVVQGGSTLTQQVAKNVFLSAERKIERKLKELPMALALELKYTKQQILSIYLNRVYLGAGTYGFEAASQRYFGKSARVVSPAEAAMLAGMLRAPSRYAPTNDLGRSQGRASVIVRLMEEQGFLTQTQVIQALADPAKLSKAAAARAGGYFADWIMETAPAYLAKDTTEDVTIATTFDPVLQRAVEEALATVFENKVKPGSAAQAAIIVMTPDGEVRAMVGGHDTGVGLFNRATHAKRQTGSAFKAVVYAAALEAGMRGGQGLGAGRAGQGPQPRRGHGHHNTAGARTGDRARHLGGDAGRHDRGLRHHRQPGPRRQPARYPRDPSAR